MSSTIKFLTTPYLRQMLRDSGFATEAMKPFHVLNAKEHEELVAELSVQHPEENDPKSRAAFREITAAPDKEENVIKSNRRAAIADWVWKIAIAILLSLALVHKGHAQGVQPSGNPGPNSYGLSVQFQNAGTPLGTRGGGRVIFNCSTNMSCSYSGNVFTLTSTGGAGSGCTPPGASGALLYDATAGACNDVTKFTSNGTTTITGLATSILDLSAAARLRLPQITSPTNEGDAAFNTTSHLPVWGFNGASTATIPKTLANASHKWINSYDQTTGTLTQTQPDYSDLTGVPATFTATAHNLLSATHGDTTAHSVVRGDLIAGIGASPAWTAVAKGGTNTYPKWNASGDVIPSTLAASGVGTPTACSSQFVTGFTLNADAAPTSTCTTVPYSAVSGTPTLFYQTVQDSSGTPVTQAATVKFTGTAVTSTATAAGVTTVTLTAGAGGSGCTPSGTTPSGVLYDTGSGNCDDTDKLTWNSGTHTFTGASGLIVDWSASTRIINRVGSGCTTTTNGDACYDSAGTAWKAWQGGADRFLIASTNKGTAGQAFLTNADGSGTFADPIISYSAPAESTAAWTSATSLNTAVTVNLITSGSHLDAVTVTLNQGTTITGGAVVFEVSDTTAFTVAYPVWCAQKGTTNTRVSSYTLTASTNQDFQCNVSSYAAFRIRLNPAITGSGTVNVGVQPSAAPLTTDILVTGTGTAGTASPGVLTVQGIASMTPLLVTPAANSAVNVAQFGGTNVVTGTGAGGAGIPRVTISNDSSLAANQSVNTAQFGGTNVSTGTGAGGAGIPRVTVSNDSQFKVWDGTTVAGVIVTTTALKTDLSSVAGTATSTAASGVQLVGIEGRAGTSFETTAGVLDYNLKNVGNAAASTAASGVLKVGVVGNAGAIFDAATGAAVPANALQIGAVGSGNLTAPLLCDNYAFYDAATNGATQLVALSSTKIIYVCGYSFTSSSTTANTLKLVYGTGTNCATGQTAMTPGFILQAPTSTGPIGKVVPVSGFTRGLKTIASNELCILTNAAAAAQAEVWYTQF